MRSPNLNIQSRMPTINPTVTPRINPTIAATAGHRTNARRHDTLVAASATSTLPNARFSPNLSPACSYANRDSRRRMPRPSRSSSADGGGAGKSAKKGKNGGARSNAPLQPALNPPAIPNEFVAEIDGSLSPTRRPMRWRGVTAWCGSQSQNFPLIGATIGLFRITDRRPVEKVRREFAADAPA